LLKIDEQNVKGIYRMGLLMKNLGK